MRRFFVPSDRIKENSAEIGGDDFNHLKNVLRAKIGDQIILCDGISKTYLASVQNISKDKVLARIEKELVEDTEPKLKITLAQSLPKASKMDYIIEKCVELGVFSIIPILSERSIPKIKDKKAAKLKRWQNIAKGAAKQCGRKIIPEIQSIIDFEDAVKLKKNYDLAIIAWELEEENSLKKVLGESNILQLGSILILIGPEGGFSRKEVEEAKSSGFVSVSLGKRILRAETAPIFVLSNIIYELEP